MPSIIQVEYLHWAKTHPRARFELTVSGIAPVTPDELGDHGEALLLEVTGAYGHPRLIELIAQRYGVPTDHVLPVTGTSSANFIALACAAEQGQRVAIEAPCYQPLLRAAEFRGLAVVRFERDWTRRFAPDLDQIERQLDLGARGVVLSNLHNPSGCLCAPQDLVQIARLCEQRSATLIVDEVYRDFAHISGDTPMGTAATLGPHVVATGSLTKVYGFGGLRAGWIISSPDFIARARRAINHLCVDLPAPSTGLAIRILQRMDRFAARTRAIFRHRYDLFSRWLASSQDLRGYGNDGAVFPYLRLPGGIRADPFCRFMRDHFDTQVVPGTFFGDPDHIRVGFGGPADDLAEGLQRLSVALERYPRADGFPS